MIKNPQFYKLRKEMGEQNTDLTPAELDELAEKKWDELHPPVSEVVEEVEPSVTTDKPKEMPKEKIMSESEVAVLVEKMQADMKKDFDKKLDALQKSMSKPCTPVEEIMDDYLEEPQSYFYHTHEHIIHSYKYKGKEVVAPFGAIKFSNLASMRTKVSGSRDDKIVQLSMVTVHSKKEVEFIENTPEFLAGTIHKKIAGAQNADSLLVDKMMQAYNAVSKMNQHQVVSACKDSNIVVTTDLDAMKKELIAKMARSAMDSEQAKLAETVKRHYDEKTAVENALMAT
jgi:hypothetical protein